MKGDNMLVNLPYFFSLVLENYIGDLPELMEMSDVTQKELDYYLSRGCNHVVTDELEIPMEDEPDYDSEVEVYDNGGKTADRFTVIIGDFVYGMSMDPGHPQGFDQFSHTASPDNLKILRNSPSTIGKRISFYNLPESVQLAIKVRMEA